VVVARRRSLQIPPRRARRSSRADDALLRVGTAAGLSAAVLAERLGRSPEQARALRRILLGRAPAGRPYLSHEDEVIRLCVRQDGDLAALPYRLGSSPGALCLHAQHLGTMPSIPAAFAELLDAQTLPSADDCARFDCVPVPSALRTIRARQGRLGHHDSRCAT
jgi:hypothetical protein